MSKPIKNKTGYKIKVFSSPDDLPSEWDEIYPEHDIFNKRIILRHLFLHNPAKQNYIWAEKSDEKILAGLVWRACVYFALGPITIYRPATVCSLPMPFSTTPGFSDADKLEGMAAAFDGFWGGFQIIYGLPRKGAEIEGWSWRRHLPTVNFDVRWDSFDEYHDSFRSDYKSRITSSLEKGHKLKVSLISAEQFDEKTYALYVGVARRYRSLVLPRNFFTEFPTESYILGLKLKDATLAWAFLVPAGRYLYFLFGGFNDKLNDAYNLYNNLLLAIVRFSIENKFEKVNLGQTAELSKMRIGGYPCERYLLVRHTNVLTNQILRKTDIFEYRKHYPMPNVFKRVDGRRSKYAT